MSSDNFSVGKVVLDTLSKYSPSIVSSNYDGLMFYGTLTLMVSTFAIYVLKKLGVCASQSRTNDQRRAVVLNGNRRNDDQNNLEENDIAEPVYLLDGGNLLALEPGSEFLIPNNEFRKKCLNEFLDDDEKLEKLLKNVFEYGEDYSTYQQAFNYFKEALNVLKIRDLDVRFYEDSHFRQLAMFKKFLTDVAVIDSEEGVPESEKTELMEKELLKFVNESTMHKVFVPFFTNALCKKVEKGFRLSECARGFIKLSELDNLDPKLQPAVLFHLFLLIDGAVESRTEIIRAIDAFRVKVRDDENAPNEIKEMFRHVFSCEVTNRHKENDVLLYRDFMVLRWMDFLVKKEKNGEVAIDQDNLYAISYDMLFSVGKLGPSDLMFLCGLLDRHLDDYESRKNTPVMFDLTYEGRETRVICVDSKIEELLQLFLNAALEKRSSLTNKFVYKIGKVIDRLCKLATENYNNIRYNNRNLNPYNWAAEMKEKYDKQSKEFSGEMEKIDLVKEIVTNPDHDLAADGYLNVDRFSIKFFKSGKNFNLAKFLLN